MISFRRFRTRVLVLVVGLVALVQGVSYWAVVRANRKNAGNVIEQNMRDGVRLFKELMEERHGLLITGAGLIGKDLALQHALQRGNRQVMQHVTDHYVRQLNITGMALMTDAGEVLAATPVPKDDEARTLMTSLARRAMASENAPTLLILSENKLLSVLVAPVDAPQTEGEFRNIRLIVTHHIDRALIERVERRTRLSLTLQLPRALSQPATSPNAPGTMPAAPAGREMMLTQTLAIPLLNAPDATLVFHRSLDDELAPVRWLEHLIAITFVVSVACAIVLAILLARSVSRPVQELARHTHVIADGDYATRIPWKRVDELGHLADALNAMSDGLAERDQVRDLLNKNVSPEVAARLISDGAVLRGEERTVTIMFVDLRGFTTISEHLAPVALFDLLNRFFDTMSAEIERRGGIIDKYIGDEIMALFGAPVTMPDAPVRAVQAALAMRAALPSLNATLVAQGLPALEFGVGICTARVLAGNVGTHRRLNYSVIGDGVNQAARLQALTRREDWHASILINDATRVALHETPSAPWHLRELGEIPLKGKTVLVRVYAVDDASPQGLRSYPLINP